MKTHNNFHVLFVGTKEEVEAAYAKWVKENTWAKVVKVTSSYDTLNSERRPTYRLAVIYGPAATPKVKDLRDFVPSLIRDELDIKKATRSLEISFIKKALKQTNGNRTHAAKILGISHRALLYKITDYGIESPSQTGRRRASD